LELWEAGLIPTRWETDRDGRSKGGDPQGATWEEDLIIILVIGGLFFVHTNNVFVISGNTLLST